MSGRAVEAAGDVDTLLLDKTGTITLGNRMATEFITVDGVSAETLADAAQLASLADETPEGRSIVVLAKEQYGLRGREVTEIGAHFIPFSARNPHERLRPRRTHDPQGRGRSDHHACPGIGRHCRHRSRGRSPTASPIPAAHRWWSAEGNKVLGVIHLKDVVKGGIRERFRALPRHGHPHGDDHRRQSAHRGGDRARSRRGRFPRAKQRRKQRCGSSKKSRPRANWWR